MIQQNNVVAGKSSVMKNSENRSIDSIVTVLLDLKVCVAVVIGSLTSMSVLVYSDLTPRYPSPLGGGGGSFGALVIRSLFEL